MAALATARQDHLVGTPHPITHPSPPRGGEDKGEGVSALADATPVEWPPRSRALGVYLHIPFCVQRCHYCSFNTGPYDRAGMERFLGALAAEIDLLGQADWASMVTVSTIFFGGGTPSLLDPDQLAAILDRLRRRFRVAPDVEVTVECNPESVGREPLEGYRKSGVNRISLGVQSLDDALLRRLGRLHSALEARAAFEATRAAGITNANLDLMYGLPGLDLGMWEATLREVLAWRPEHLSAYCLTLDEGSRWAHDTPSGLPSGEAIADQYWLLARLAREAGLDHYEISNYCRPGFACRHNLVYWHAEEYLGFGPGACGYLDEIRYTNTKPVPRYCSIVEAGTFPLGQWERLTPRQRRAERMILGLRLGEGIPRPWLDARIAEEPDRLAAVVQAWESHGLLTDRDGRVTLTEAGFLLSDSLFVDLL